MKINIQDRFQRLAAFGPLALNVGSIDSYEDTDAIDARIDPRTERAIAARNGAVALISVRGVIVPRERSDSRAYGEVGAENLASRVEAAVADPKVKAIILDVDSPGGNVFGVHEAAARIKAARGKKPIVAHADFLMASAAYWLATAADEVIASPSALVGSVGVISMHADISKLLADFGVKVTAIAEPAEKADGNMFEPLTDTARTTIHDRISAYYGDFAGAVMRARNASAADVRKNYVGVHPAPVALKFGMIDKIRDMPSSVGAYLSPANGAPVALMQRAINIRRNH